MTTADTAPAVVAPAAPIAEPVVVDPRSPKVRMAALFDPGSFTIITAEDDGDLRDPAGGPRHDGEHLAHGVQRQHALA